MFEFIKKALSGSNEAEIKRLRKTVEQIDVYKRQTSHISIQSAHGDVAGQHGFRFAVRLPDQRAVLAEVQRLALAAIYTYRCV